MEDVDVESFYRAHGVGSVPLDAGALMEEYIITTKPDGMQIIMTSGKTPDGNVVINIRQEFIRIYLAADDAQKRAFEADIISMFRKEAML